MTVVVAFIDDCGEGNQGGDGRTVVGADSMCSIGEMTFELHGEKFVKLGNTGWIAGCAGASIWMRFARVFSEALEGGKLSEEMERGSFADAVPELFSDMWVKWGAEREHGGAEGGHWGLCGQWLLARHGQIVLIGSDGSIIEPREGYHAIGSGAEVAMGALWVFSRAGDDERVATACHAENAVAGAIAAASAHAEGVGGMISVVTCDLPPEPGEAA